MEMTSEMLTKDYPVTLINMANLLSCVRCQLDPIRYNHRSDHLEVFGDMRYLAESNERRLQSSTDGRKSKVVKRKLEG